MARATSFGGAAALTLRDRDQWIGWSQLQRSPCLKLIAQNRRYLLFHEKGTERCNLKASQHLMNQFYDLENKTVTAGPLHCQRQSARMIVEKGGDYLFLIKGNQPKLYK